MFSLFGAVLGLSWGPCWLHFRSLTAILGAFWAILGLARAGQGSQVKLNQVKAGQDRFGDRPGSGTRAGLGREGFPGHIRMGLHWKTHPVQNGFCERLGCMFGGLTASWARFGGVLAPLGLSWGSPGTS